MYSIIDKPNLPIKFQCSVTPCGHWWVCCYNSTHNKLSINTLVKCGDIDNLTVFIRLLIITFYKIHMGVIFLALKAASLPVSPFNSPLCDCQDESQLISTKYKQRLEATFFKLRPYASHWNTIKSLPLFEIIALSMKSYKSHGETREIIF